MKTAYRSSQNDLNSLINVNINKQRLNSVINKIFKNEKFKDIVSIGSNHVAVFMEH